MGNNWNPCNPEVVINNNNIEDKEENERRIGEDIHYNMNLKLKLYADLFDLKNQSQLDWVWFSLKYQKDICIKWREDKISLMQLKI